jgi:hypothetical protein
MSGAASDAPGESPQAATAIAHATKVHSGMRLPHIAGELRRFSDGAIG